MRRMKSLVVQEGAELLRIQSDWTLALSSFVPMFRVDGTKIGMEE